MKKRQFYTLLGVIILGFGIVIYQNYRILDYNKVLDERQGLIYKDTGRLIGNIDTNMRQLEKIENMIQANYIELKRSI